LNYRRRNRNAGRRNKIEHPKPTSMHCEIPPGLLWVLRIGTIAIILTVYFIYLLKNPYFITDVDEAGYLENAYYADKGGPTMGWRLRCYFYPLILSMFRSAAELFTALPAYEMMEVFRFSNLLISSSVIFFIYLLGRMIFDETVGLVAAVFMGTSPGWLDSAAHVMMEAPFTAFFTGAICFLMMSLVNRQKWPLCISAVFTGAAIMTKFDGVLLLPLIVIVYTVFRISPGVSCHRGSDVQTDGTHRIHHAANFFKIRTFLLYFGVTFLGMLLCYVILEILYWKNPFCSAHNFYLFNFVEKKWLSWYPERLGTMVRFQALVSLAKVPYLVLGAAGLIYAFLRNRTVGIVLSIISGTLIGARMGMYYFLPRFWVVLLPFIYLLAASGLRSIINFLFLPVSKRHKAVSAVLAVVCACCAILFYLKEYSGVGDRFKMTRTAGLASAFSVAKLSGGLVKGGGGAVTIASLSPHVFPRYIFPSCRYVPFFFAGDLAGENLNRVDILIIPIHLSGDQHFQGFRKATGLGGYGVSVYLRENLWSCEAILLRKNALDFSDNADGTPLPEGLALWENGTVSESITVTEPGLYRISIEAKGTPAEMIFPKMTLKVSGEVLKRWHVRDGKWSHFEWMGHLFAGKKWLQISYENDFRSKSEDRDLFIGFVSVVRSESCKRH
jgi:hypothetical protein